MGRSPWLYGSAVYSMPTRYTNGVGEGTHALTREQAWHLMTKGIAETWIFLQGCSERPASHPPAPHAPRRVLFPWAAAASEVARHTFLVR